MPKRDYYTVLGISRTASDDEIKQAFRKLAKKFHPDTTKEIDKIGAEGKFREVNEAFIVLSNPTKRTKYDKYGHNTTESTISQSQTGKEGGRGPKSSTRPGTETNFENQFGGLDLNSLFGSNNIFSEMFGFGQQPVGKDDRGWFFAMPNKDVMLLSAMYKLRVEASNGRKGIVYDTGIYRVSLGSNDECRIHMRPKHWRSSPGEVRTSSYGLYDVIDPNIPVDINEIGYAWTNIERPPGVNSYLQAVDSLSKKLTMTGTIDIQREHRIICSYGFNNRVVERFDTRRLGLDEAHKIVKEYSAEFRDIRVENGGEKTRR